MPRYKLRTLLALLGILPPLLALAWFGWQQYQAELARREAQTAFQSTLERPTTSFIPATAVPVELPVGTIVTKGPIEATQPEAGK